MELAEDLSDLVRMKVLEDTEVVHTVERARLERQVEDARLLDPTRVRVVTGVEPQRPLGDVDGGHAKPLVEARIHLAAADRKSTRLNSSHGYISYAVFCLKKKIENQC